MKVYDLTHTITDDMPVYSAVNKPIIKKFATIEKDGYEETYLTIFSHNGTHIDSTKHMDSQGKTLDQLEIDNFVGKAIIIDLNGNSCIDIEHLMKYKEKILNSDFIIFKSGWSKYWGYSQYYSKYPLLTKTAAHYLASTPIKGVGIDMLSVDSYNSIGFEIHKILFEGGKLIIENLTNLENLPDEFLFVATPLKYNNADGSPVRAIAIVND